MAHDPHVNPAAHAAHHAPHAPHVNYKKIYIILLVLLAISIAGPTLGIPWLTLITAFGIAIVKATLVVQNFMHLKWEQKIMKWVLLASVVIVGLFYFAVRPDVGAHVGQNWVNDGARAAVARGIPAPHGEAGEGGPAADHGAAPAPAAHPPAAAAPDSAPAVAATPAFDARGSYRTICSSCHGMTGEGNGPAAAAMNPKPANFSSAAFWTGKTDAHIVKVIREGGAAVGKSPLMPAWGSMFNPAQAQAMTDYLKTLKR
jgi:caa(3)-type oxidase subunit IV